jgi:hypothetical protein
VKVDSVNCGGRRANVEGFMRIFFSVPQFFDDRAGANIQKGYHVQSQLQIDPW